MLLFIMTAILIEWVVGRFDVLEISSGLQDRLDTGPEIEGELLLSVRFEPENRRVMTHTASHPKKAGRRRGLDCMRVD